MSRTKEKVLAVYPEAEVVHTRVLGRLIYGIRAKWLSSLGLGFGYTAAQAWKDAARRIDDGIPPEKM